MSLGLSSDDKKKKDLNQQQQQHLVDISALTAEALASLRENNLEHVRADLDLCATLECHDVVREIGLGASSAEGIQCGVIETKSAGASCKHVFQKTAVAAERLEAS